MSVPGGQLEAGIIGQKDEVSLPIQKLKPAALTECRWTGEAEWVAIKPMGPELATGAGAAAARKEAENCILT